jgi:hypothetical protein
MNGLRRGDVPHSFIVAEIAAAPFSSCDAFANRLQTLSPSLRGDSGILWQRVESSITSRFPGVSVDEATTIRDLAWFRADAVEQQIADLPTWYRTGLLHAIGQAASQQLLQADCDKASRRLALRWFGLAMPPPLFAGSAVPEIVLPVMRILERGFAECHLHLGGALRFETAWSNLGSAFLTKPGAVVEFLGTSQAWEDRRAPACVALAWLFQVYASLFPAEESDDRRYERLREAMRRAGLLGSSAVRVWSLLENARREATVPDSAVAYEDAFRSLWRVARYEAALERITASTEEFMRGPLSPGGSGGLLHLQVLRGRTLFYRYLVQRPLTPGLQHFFRHFDRLRRVKSSPASLVVEASYLSGAGAGLRALELRVAPQASLRNLSRDFADWTRGVSLVNAANPEIDVSLVVHFIRTTESGLRLALPHALLMDSEANPGSSLNRWRHEGFYRRALHEAVSLRDLLRNSEAARSLIRGVDVCTDEAGVPTWAISRALLHASGRSFGSVGPRLRLSAHCGEDYVHLASGLRRVHEAVAMLDLDDGDRLGHAIALGRDVTEWAHSTQVVAMRQEERLWDLVWIWEWLRSAATRGALSLEPIVAEAERIAADIFRRPVRMVEVSELGRALASGQALVDIGYATPLVRGNPDPLLIAYLSVRSVFLRGSKVIVVPVAPDLDYIVACQEILQEYVSRRGVAVEVNLSSNMLMANLVGMRSHPLWRLSALEQARVGSRVPIVLGSDDPITFATSLPQEYQLAYDLLITGGLSPDDAAQWLERVRQTGLLRRF